MIILGGPHLIPKAKPDMQQEYALSLIAGGCAIAGSAITGLVTYLVSVSKRKHNKLKKQLIQAYEDIIAFYRLEERYTQALATEQKSAESWKRETRKKLRSDGYESPRDGATINVAQARISDLK